MRRKSPPAFFEHQSDEGIGADVVVIEAEPAEIDPKNLTDDQLAEIGDALDAEGARLADELGLDEHGNAPVARLVKPEPVTHSVLPEAAVAEWQERILALDARLAAAKQRLAELANEAEIIEIGIL